MDAYFDTAKAAPLIAGNLTTATYVRLMIAAFRGESDVDATTAGTKLPALIQRF